jgi:hypothetical protein
MVLEMALPSGSTDNVASHIQVRHTGATVAQVIGPIVVSLSVGVELLVDPLFHGVEKNFPSDESDVVSGISPSKGLFILCCVSSNDTGRVLGGLSRFSKTSLRLSAVTHTEIARSERRLISFQNAADDGTSKSFLRF